MLIATLIILGVIALDFLLSAGLVWLFCWAVGVLGFTVVFTWKLALAVWVIVAIIQGLIRGCFPKNN